MVQWIRDGVAAHRLARLERLAQQARAIDELLAFGQLSPDTRAQLHDRREDLQRRARDLLFGWLAVGVGCWVGRQEGSCQRGIKPSSKVPYPGDHQ